MQKLWFKSKRSQPLLPEEDIHSSSPATKDSQQTSTAPDLSTSETVGQETEKFALTKQGILKYSSQIPQKSPEWQISPTWVILSLGVGGIGIVTMLGMQYLTAPEATPDSTLTCRSKVSGDWQTPIGKLTLQEERGDMISGKYEYTNFDRGKIIGEFTGKLNNNVINFDWQETPKQQTKQQGKGILIFGEGCKEFYGSYGTGESTSNFGNWQGSRMSK
ncbi:hypothetical protein [Pseudanabaena yagii]|uniref:Uncharacterized protein n=1 Tax=Pseudanabaena yagii GIHE-NHR1 TaxID=2722753 RepID=A0ABX1M002_9CYAN|nr:hypothetical protein [Pseudanabaena yagii]NMF60916.1 hypothetical protein [Pseudanabaena yagii GIHE-NHR1]